MLLHCGRGRRRRGSRFCASRLSGSFLRKLFNGGPLFGGSLGVRLFTKVFPHLFSGGKVDGTRVRFLFGDPGLGQELDDEFCLHLELSRQFIDADLIGLAHSPPALLLTAFLV
jgi:hypothetical protein